MTTITGNKWIIFTGANIKYLKNEQGQETTFNDTWTAETYLTEQEWIDRLLALGVLQVNIYSYLGIEQTNITI